MSDEDPQIVTEFLVANSIRALAMGAITDEGGERVIMLEVVGLLSGTEEETFCRIVMTKGLAAEMWANLAVTIEGWDDL